MNNIENINIKNNNILIIIDNISQNFRWNKTCMILKRWLIYYINQRIIKKNINTLTIAKTFPIAKSINFDLNNLDINKIIVFLDSILIKQSMDYSFTNIENILNIIIKNNNLELNEIYIFASIFNIKDAKIEYDNKYNDDNFNINTLINIFNFSSYSKIISNNNINEILIQPKYINYDNILIEINKILNIKENILTDYNYELFDKFQLNIYKLFLIESDLILSLTSKFNSEITEQDKYLISSDNLIKYINFINLYDNKENLDNDCKFMLNTKKILKMMLIEYENIDFNIPNPCILNTNIGQNYDTIYRIIQFYKYIYPKILYYHLNYKYKKQYIFKFKNTSKIDIKLNNQIFNYLIDESIEYLTSNISMTHWKDEFENFNSFGLLLKYNSNLMSCKGFYDIKSKILTTYPNTIISSISNNWISLYDYYQLVMDDIDINNLLSFNINNYELIDMLHGNSNIMLPIYINKEHWKLVKSTWSYHLTFINNTFEFDYNKKMDNIYFIVCVEIIKNIIKKKSNVNFIRLLIYIIRTSIQICIDNKYSYNIKITYEKFKNILFNTKTYEKFNLVFIDYLYRLIQIILTGNIEFTTLIIDLNQLFQVYLKLLVKLINTTNETITDENIIKKICTIEEIYTIQIVSISTLFIDLLNFCALMNEFYKVKKFNQFIKYIDKYNGCIPINTNDFNYQTITTIITNIENMQLEKNLNLNYKIIIKDIILHP